MSETYNTYLVNQNKRRIEEQTKLFTYYVGSPNTDPSVLTYLDEVLHKTFDDADIEQMQMFFINITKMIVDKLAILYKEPAKRILVKEDGKLDEDMTDYFNSILPEDINTIDKQAHRYGKLFNTSISQVVFDEASQRFNILVDPSQDYDVISNQFNNEVEKISYERYFDDELYRVVWTEEEHYRISRTSDKKEPIGKNTQMKNVFEIVPFPFLQLQRSKGFWGEGMNDVVNTNEQVNFLFVFLINDNIILGSSGTLLAINLQLDKKTKEKDGHKELVAGRRRIINVEGARSDEITPDMQHITSNPLIDEIHKSIDNIIKLQAIVKGLNPNAVLGMVKDTSDYQKMVDTISEIEVRRDDIAPCKSYEQRRFEVIRKMNNYYKDTGNFDKLKTIDESLRLKVDFAEPEVPMTPADLQARRDWEKANNMSSNIEWLMEDNSDLTREDAEKIIEQNKIANEVKRTTTLDDLLTQNNLQIEEEENEQGS